MPTIPENPLTRGEMFLNAAATGNTSGLPDPKTREEMYLEAIAEGGSSGTDVVANPTLAGTEADLTGLQVGDTKYKVGGSSGGGVLVVHGEMDKDDPGVIKNVDASVADIAAFVHGGGMAFFVLNMIDILPCVSALLDDYNGSLVVFSDMNLYVSEDDPAEITKDSIYGTSGTPDTWTAEQTIKTLS